MSHQSTLRKSETLANKAFPIIDLYGQSQEMPLVVNGRLKRKTVHVKNYSWKRGGHVQKKRGGLEKNKKQHGVFQTTNGFKVLNWQAFDGKLLKNKGGYCIEEMRGVEKWDTVLGIAKPVMNGRFGYIQFV